MKRLYLHGCNAITCILKKNDNIVTNDYVRLDDNIICRYDENNSINIFSKSKYVSDIACIKANRLYISYQLDMNVKSNFTPVKVKYKNQYVDHITFLKLIDKKQEHILEFEESYSKLSFRMLGAYNQLVTFYSVSNDTDVFISLFPHKFNIDDSELYNIDFDEIHYRYPYAWVGKLTREVSFIVTNNVDITFYISIFKNPQDFRIKIKYYNPDEYAKPVKGIVNHHKVFKIIKNLSSASEVETLYEVVKAKDAVKPF